VLTVAPMHGITVFDGSVEDGSILWAPRERGGHVDFTRQSDDGAVGPERPSATH
jgi:hypothetical protein